MARYRNITNPFGAGYQVRVYREGKEHSGYFSYKQYGGARPALSAAVKWRDIQKKKLPPPMKRPVRSNTGIRGISRVTKYDKRYHRTYVMYGVYYPKNSKAWSNKCFSVGYEDEITQKDETKILKEAKIFLKRAIARINENSK